MKRLNLFWKTWIITLIAIFVCIGLFVSVVYISATILFANKQESQFTSAVQAIEQYITTNGIDTKYLNQQLSQGIMVTVVGDQGELLYPSKNIYMESAVSTEETISNSSNNYSEQFDVIIVGDDNLSVSDVLAYDTQIQYEGKQFFLSISYTGANNTLQFLITARELIPQFLIIALLFSGVVSIIYAYFFTNKVKHLNTLMADMATQTVVVPEIASTKDEFQQLENNLYLMYQQLQTVLTELTTENKYVKRLEADRQVFMRGATHELKTPIMTMSSMLEGMIEKIQGYEDTEKYLQACLNEVQQMTQLVQEILEVSKLDTIKFDGKTQVHMVIAEVIATYQYLLDDKALQIDCTIPIDFYAPISTKNLVKVYANLLSNAIKYAQTNTTIIIEAKERKLLITNSIADTKFSTHPDLMEAFVSYPQQCDEQIGHGLGLYIVGYILKQYQIPYEYVIDKEQITFTFIIDFDIMKPNTIIK